MPDDRSSSPESLIASVFALPFVIGAKFVDDLPTTIVKARRQVQLARFVGKMAVDQGAQELRRRLTAPPADRAAPSPRHVPTAAPATEVVDAAPAEGAGPVPDAEHLALPDYDQLPAAHIVGKLAGLTQDERDAIRAHELAHRHRRTVLGKLSQLDGA